jgi:hypothetical protein
MYSYYIYSIQIHEEFLLDFNLVLKRFCVLFIEIGSPNLVQAALNLLYCLMDLKPVIYLPLLKMFAKSHQV